MAKEAFHSSTPLLTADQWSNISWVLLDMDGTLLDLCFDNAFWREELPRLYADQAKITEQQAQKAVETISERVYGTLDWYCIDFWSNELGFDIRPGKSRLAHLIGFRAGALAFLKWLKHQGKHVILATNAHPDSIALKETKTDLSEWVDVVLHAHDAGAPKEDQIYWQWLQEKTQYDCGQALFIDDNDHILDSAKTAGIAYCVGVSTPSSSASAKSSRYPAFDHFQELYPASI